MARTIVKLQSISRQNTNIAGMEKVITKILTFRAVQLRNMT